MREGRSRISQELNPATATAATYALLPRGLGALGLLVDDPVLASDSIKRTLSEGHPNIIASWLGPTKLATAIMYATVTNIVAYLPFLMVTGTTGEFLHSLPIVMTCALVASRLVSMTFLP